MDRKLGPTERDCELGHNGEVSGLEDSVDLDLRASELGRHSRDSKACRLRGRSAG